MTLTNKVDDLFSEWNRPESPGFALAIIRDDEIIYKRGYGTANLEYDIPISSNSVFDTGSISKQFTAMCIALLAKQGKLSLDDEIQKHVLEMPRYENLITIRHLIHHTSGIRDYLTLMDLAGMRFENEYPEDEIVGLIARQKDLNFEPGDEFLYSNSGYFLLAEIVQRVSGKSLRTFADENIFTPLKMKNSHFHDDFTIIVKDRAIGYSPKSEGGFRIDISLFDGVGDGAVYTTVEDLFLWDRNFSKNILGGVGQELIEEVTTPGTLNSGETLDYAFGLHVGQYRGQKMVSHGGAWAGYRAEMVRFPEQRFSVICLSNLGSTNPTKIAKKIADIYLATEFAAHQKANTQSEIQFIEIPAVDLESKTGSYLSTKAGSILDLSIKDGSLMIESSYPIAPISQNHFVDVQFPEIEIKFSKPNSDEPTQMSVSIESGKPDIYQRLTVVALKPEQLSDFVGEYYCEDLDVTYKITSEDNKLLLNRRNSSKENLKQTIKDLLNAGGVTLQFIRDDHSRIVGFNLGAGRAKNIRFTKKI